MIQSVRSLSSHRAGRLALAGLAALGGLSAALSAGCGAAPPANQNTGETASGGQPSSSGGTTVVAAAGTYALAGQSSGGGGAANAQGGTGGSTVIVGFSGAAGANSGSGGAATAGAGTGGGSGGSSTGFGCAGKNYKLCEDFETGTAGGLPTGWTTFKGYGAASAQDQALATDQFHSGKMALKSQSGKSGASRIQKSIASLGATASKHWGRIFYKVQPPPANNPFVHATFVGLTGMGENRVVDIVESANSLKHQWLYNNPDDKGSAGSAYNWTFDAAWHCAEWYIDVSTKSYRFFSDAMEVTGIAFTNKADSEMSNYMSIIVGVTYYQGVTITPPFTVWFDDLAINDTQVGCN